MRDLLSKWLLTILICLSLEVSSMTVNRLNGGGNITYVDFSLEGDIIPLELTRSYNSITAVNESNGWLGAFGWGWTSEFETTLTVTPDRNVLLRDGGTGNTILFRKQKDSPESLKRFLLKVKRAYFLKKEKKNYSDKQLGSKSLPKRMRTRLRTDPIYRAKIASEYRIVGKVPQPELLVSTQYGYQSMEFRGNLWIRRKDGVTQTFDNQGRLIKKEDKSGYFVTYKYSPTNRLQLSRIESRNKSASLKFTWRSERVVRVTDNLGVVAKFEYDKRKNLIKAKDGGGQTYVYRYGNPKFKHLLTKIEYPDESTKTKKIFREIGYDRNGLVVKHRDKDASEVKYIYGRGTKDPKNNFWTRTIFTKKRAPTDPEEQYDEFSLKTRADGSKYLYKQESKRVTLVKGKRQVNSVTTVFTACCGKPAQIIQDGRVSKFKYFENGLLKEKITPQESVRLQYDPLWNKVSRVDQNGKVSTYNYDDQGNLYMAKNEKQSVTMEYDTLGRIRLMKDKVNGDIRFEYGGSGRRPIKIVKKKVGILNLQYDGEGRIVRHRTALEGVKRTPTAAESQLIVRRVMRGFQNLLDIIRPAAQVNESSPFSL